MRSTTKSAAGNYLRAALLAGVVLPAVVCAALAQAPPLTEDARRKLEASKQSLEAQRQREQGLTRDVEQLEAEKARINRNLIDTAKAIQSSEARLTALEARIGELEQQEKLVRGSLEQNHGHIAKLLGAMQRMGRNPPPVMVTRREDALVMVRSAMLLAAVFPELREQALLLSDKLNELARVLGEIRRDRDQVKAETTRLAEARTRIDGLLSQKRENIVERQVELREVRAAAAELARNVTDLNELIARTEKMLADKAGMGGPEREPAPDRQAVATVTPPIVVAPDPAVPPATSPAPVPPAATPAPKPPAAAPEQKMAAAPPVVPTGPMVAPQPFRPAKPFDKMKASLPLPTQGRRVYGFGDRTEIGGVSKGAVFETRVGAQITSPSDGWIVYAGEFRSYGQLLIINAGGGYHVVLAGLSRITAVVGQAVLAGEPVGTMGAAAAPAEGRAARQAGGAAGKNQDTAPLLYVEFRKDGRSIDPAPWWAIETPQKVQG